MKTMILMACAAIALGGATRLHAQLQPTMHRSLDMIAVAREEARTTLPSDAVLALIGAVGDAEPVPGVRLRISADSGTASAWAYIYHIPSQNRWTALAVVDIEMLGAQVYEMDPPTPIPPTLTSAVRLDLPFSESGAMATRLAGNSDYLEYREQYPAKRPSIVSYRDPLPEDAQALPDGFPLDAPVWTISYVGAGDETMMVWVSARTGEVVCRRVSVAGVGEEASAPDALVSPNPASGTATITLPARGTSTPSVVVHDAAGRRARVTTRIERAGDALRIELDLTGLESGVYVVAVDGSRDVVKLTVR